MVHVERHRTAHIGWLRAAVLGANDGLISTSSLIVGVAAAQAERSPIMLAAVAGLVAGALSMAAGEYVSVSSQADTESADIERERRELADDPSHEHAELTGIYVKRGLTAALAAEVAEQLMTHDALGAHSRDELGMSEHTLARPLQAALASAAAFAVGAILPVVLVWIAPLPQRRTARARHGAGDVLGRGCDGRECARRSFLRRRRLAAHSARIRDVSAGNEIGPHRLWRRPDPR
jgi:VIT1/CCC1 family predicted Fe2+/Mn2+ transporter